MKVKYISDDGYEFETKTQCEKYEGALDEIKEISGLPMKEIDGKKWFKISSVAEFYFFDHMEDHIQKSTKSMYDISKIAFKINHYMPFWITKDFEEGIMIDKKRVEVIDQSINFFNEEIENLKEEKKMLENLRGMEITDDDYKSLVSDSQPTQQESPRPKKEPKMVREDGNVKPKGIEHAQKVLASEGIQLEGIDIVELAKEEAQLTNEQWNNLDNNKIENLIEEQINILI